MLSIQHLLTVSKLENIVIQGLRDPRRENYYDRDPKRAEYQISLGLANIKKMVEALESESRFEFRDDKIKYPAIVFARKWSFDFNFITSASDEYSHDLSKRELLRLITDLKLDDQASRIYPPFYHDTERGPEEIWLWSQRKVVWDDSYSLRDVVNDLHNDILRRQAYVMWDRSRLDIAEIIRPLPDDFPNSFMGEFDSYTELSNSDDDED